MDRSDRTLDIAVVVPVYNDEAQVADAVRSVLAIAGVRELIVVDDGSGDRSAEVARRAAAGDERLVVHTQSNAGPAAARNTGARLASAEYLIFLDSDDVLLSSAVETFRLGLAQRRTRAALVRAGASIIATDGSERIRFPVPHDGPFPRGAPLTGSWMVARTLYLEVGGSLAEIRYGENTDVLLRIQLELARRGDQPAFVMAPTVCYRPRHVSNDPKIWLNRLNSAQVSLERYPLEYAADPEMHFNTLSIASEMARRLGHRREAARFALRAVKVRPGQPKAWLRLGRALVLVTGR